MGVMVNILVQMPEFWIFISALFVSCAALAVFLWRMEAGLFLGEKKKVEKNEMDGAAALLASMGYDYDARQDILISRRDAWQREYGYCRLYDEAAALCGILIDCEPITFEFEGRRWLLELWKGQYGIAAGAEIGLYYTDKPDISIPDVFTGPFYACVPDEESPITRMTLFRCGRAVFTLEERHWWLAGHRLGLYTRSNALALRASVTFKSVDMAQAVYNALFTAGYTPWEIGRVDETVFITFTRPHTPQPRTQKGLFARLMRVKLWWAARLYNQTIKNLSGMDEILQHLRAKSPMLHRMLTGSVRSRDVLTARGTLQDVSIRRK